MLAVSAELGIAFAVGAVLYALYLAVMSGPRWLILAAAPPLAFALFAVTVGGNYFHALATFGDGSFNSVVDPSRIHIDILILAAVAVSPYAMAGLVRSNPAGASGVVGMYGAALAMLPSALGRCDALHTFFNGIGIALLALLAIRSWSAVWPRVWVALFILSACWSQATQAGRLFPQVRTMILLALASSAFFLLSSGCGSGMASPCCPSRVPRDTATAMSLQAVWTSLRWDVKFGSGFNARR